MEGKGARTLPSALCALATSDGGGGAGGTRSGLRSVLTGTSFVAPSDGMEPRRPKAPA